jgi:hypothetical protein
MTNAASAAGYTLNFNPQRLQKISLQNYRGPGCDRLPGSNLTLIMNNSG